MRLDITGRHFEITPPLRQLVERNLSRIERILNDSIVSVRVILTLEKYRHRTEIILHARGDKMLSGQGEGNKWPVSVRQAIEKLEQQASTVKTKWEARRSEGRRRVPRAARAGAAAAVAATAVAGQRSRAEAADTGGTGRVIRATRYAIKPMSVEDAALRLEDSAESFLVFRNAESDAVGILFRRKDGNLGLIEPS
jgi:putative sigma-54 modulation protein